ncbi:MAG TPA: transposase [Aggregatilineales bacterium]|nr:transposase [Aggregatilineales bacterium]
MTERLLREQFSFHVEGYKISTSMVLNVLLKAAVEKRSIEAVCDDLTDVVDSNTRREAVNRGLTVEDLRQHEAEFNAALAECVPSAMPRRGLEMAVDFHDEPYYGQSKALQDYTCRGEAHDGTTYFWRIASLYVIWRQVRITLALTYVLPKESMLDILQRLLKRGAALGFRAKVLYLDKGFCNGEIIGYLQKAHQPTVIACPIRGKKDKGGTRALCHGRKHYRTRYTFTDGTRADLAVVPTLKRNKKTGKRQRTWLVYVLIHLDWSAKQTQQRYRRRFRIESSYRQLGQVRAHTNSRNVALRFFFLALALVLLDVWIYLRCACTRVIGQGPFRLDLNQFRLARFIAFLRRAIEQLYGTVLSIPIYTR